MNKNKGFTARQPLTTSPDDEDDEAGGEDTIITQTAIAEAKPESPTTSLTSSTAGMGLQNTSDRPTHLPPTQIPAHS